MVDPEKQNIPEKSSDSFLNSISNALIRLKQKLLPPKSPDLIKEQTLLKESQESYKELLDLHNEVLVTKEKHEVKSELFDLHQELITNKQSSGSKDIPFQYIPNHVDTVDWLQKNQDKRIAAPRIAKSADDLRDTIKGSSILNYFLG